MHTDKLVEAYLNGLSSIAVAHKFGVSKTTVLRHLNKFNIPKRNLSEACRKNKIDSSFFDLIDTEEKSYWLGFLLADGNISRGGRYKQGRVLRIALQKRDKPHLDKLKKSLKSSHLLKYDAQHKCWWFAITCKQLVMSLQEKGWDQFKKRGKTKIVKCMNQNLIKHLLRGLIDGDGWIHRSNGNCIIGFTNLHKSIVEWFAKEMRNQGVKSDAKVRQPKNHKNWVIQYKGTHLTRSIINILYKDCTIYLDRKNQIAISSF